MSSCISIIISLLTFLLTEIDAGSDFTVEEERSYPTPVQNSTQLPRLLDSLSKQKYSPDTTDDIYVEYDYIIVGAGAAGSVLASRLSEVPCISVLLLEAGPAPPQLTDVLVFGTNFYNTDLDWKHESVPQRHTGSGLRNRQLPLYSAKCLGGSTSHNNGVNVRGNKKDYNDWAMMGAKGWSYEEVLPYFKKLEDNRVFRNVYHGVGGPITVELPRYISELKQPLFKAITAMGYQIVDHNADRQIGFFELQANLRDAQRCSNSKAYLVPAENRTNLDILTNAFVLKVIIENRQAVGVQFDYNGRTYEIHTRREVIVSGGALNTPQLLMLSGIGPKEHLSQFNIPVLADLPVGMNFQDHGAISIEAVIKPCIKEFGKKLSSEAYIEEYITNRSGPLASVDGRSYGAFLYNDEIYPTTDVPNYEMYLAESPVKAAAKLWNLKPEVYQQVYGPYQNSSIMTCFTSAIEPKSRGRIQLRSANPYDHPVIDPNYLAEPSDVEDIVAGLKTCKRIFDRPEMRKVIVEPFQTRYPGCEDLWYDEDAYFRCMARTILYPFFHFCCSARMGDFDDPTTVVDPQLKVKHIKGLRVVDASVMPKITHGNTGIPVTMIGEKAADMIKETIQCEDY